MSVKKKSKADLYNDLPPEKDHHPKNLCVLENDRAFPFAFSIS